MAQRSAPPSTNPSAPRDYLRSDWSSLRGLLQRLTAPTSFLSHLPRSVPTKDDLTLFGICLPPELSNAELSQRWSAYLFSKCIPKVQDEQQMYDAYFAKLSAPPPNSTHFTYAMSTMVNDLFPIGWDQNYAECVSSYNLKDGATTEFGHVEEWDLDPFDFHLYTTTNTPAPLDDDWDLRRVQAVPDAGKLRIITVASKWQHLLAPLHHVLYDFLTAGKFASPLVSSSHGGPVLRGEPQVRDFEGFKTPLPDERDEHIVSGDYEAATDNLSPAHTLSLLRLLRHRSTHIPASIWDLAERSLTGRIYTASGDRITRLAEQTNGLLMGNFLSFPLLCLQNLATLYNTDVGIARYLIRTGKVKINGDDIVFKAFPEFCDMWFRNVHESGFVINRVKTAVHRSVFTLNSKMFVIRGRGSGKKVRKVWHLIPKGIFNKGDAHEKPDYQATAWGVIREHCKGQTSRVSSIINLLGRVMDHRGRRTNLYAPHIESAQEYKSAPPVWRFLERVKFWDLTHDRRSHLEDRGVADAEKLEEVRKYMVKEKTEKIEGRWKRLDKKVKNENRAFRQFTAQLQSFNGQVKSKLSTVFRKVSEVDLPHSMNFPFPIKIWYGEKKPREKRKIEQLRRQWTWRRDMTEDPVPRHLPDLVWYGKCRREYQDEA